MPNSRTTVNCYNILKAFWVNITPKFIVFKAGRFTNTNIWLKDLFQMLFRRETMLHIYMGCHYVQLIFEY